MSKLNPREINTTALAFLGDAVYEVYVRNHLMENGDQNADRLHSVQSDMSAQPDRTRL